MALENTDLFITQRPASDELFKLPASALQTRLPDGDVDNIILIWNGATWVPGQTANDLPDGDANNPVLVWDGSDWVAGMVDGGEYAV